MAFCEVSHDQSHGTLAGGGDFGFKVLTASDRAEKISAELTGGRLAMMCETSSPSKVQVTKSKPNKRFRFNPDTSQHQRKLGKPFAQTTQATQGKVVDT